MKYASIEQVVQYLRENDLHAMADAVERLRDSDRIARNNAAEAVQLLHEMKERLQPSYRHRGPVFTGD